MSSAPERGAGPAALAARIIAAASARLVRWRRATGEIRCPVHHIEHLGKSAFALIDDVRRARPAGEIEREALRLAASLRPHPWKAGCEVFGPGASERRNPSNFLIDGGTISVALARAARVLETTGRDSSALRAALARHAQSYLAEACCTKEVPVQRAWGAWGLAESAALLDDRDLAAAARRAVEGVLATQREDGSFPYTPGDRPAGSSSPSAFYHSRNLAFALCVERALELELIPADQLAAGLGWLRDLLLAKGAKVLAPEAKPWYFTAPYEVASAPFDLFLLVAGALRLSSPEAASDAGRVLAHYAHHIDPHAGILPFRGSGVAFQCPLFFSAHALFLGEIDHASWERLEALAQGKDAKRGWRMRRDFACYRDGPQSAHWRLANPYGPGRLHGDGAAGRPLGALAGAAEGGWRVRARRLPRFLVPRSGRFGELRFAFYLYRCEHRRAGTRSARRRALARLGRRLWSFFAAHSPWAWATLARTGGAEIAGRRLHCRLEPADRCARTCTGVAVAIEVRPSARGCALREDLILAEGVALREARWQAPRGAGVVRIEGVRTPCRSRRWKRLRGPLRIRIRYTLVP